jgi:hypothetical protein
LADWLELGALLAKDRNSSYGDLERVLRRSALAELQTDEEIERKIAEVADELNQRSQSAADAYPFRIDGSVIGVRPRIRSLEPYLFCLCLSYFGDRRRPGDTIFPRRLFEDLSSAAAGNYLSGAAIRFGSPRSKGIPRAFSKAVTALCMEHIGEGQSFREQPVLKAKDGGLDVVAWRDSPDRLPGKLLLFGACASGDDWDDDKLGQLNPDSFCKEWLAVLPVSLIKAFFIPHRIEPIRWNHVSWKAGIIFDRCRIAFWAMNGYNRIDYSEYKAWTQSVLRSARI